MSHLCVFGCGIWVHQDKGKKWDPNSKLMILVGYELGPKAYQLWNPHAHSIIVSTTVHFNKSVLPNKLTKPPVSPPIIPLPASVPKPTYITIKPSWFLREPTFHDHHPPVAPVQQPQPAPIQAPSTPSSSSHGSLSPPVSHPPTPSHFTAEPSYSSLPSSPSPNSDHTQPPPKLTTWKSTCVTKLVIRYEGGSLNLLSADPEGEDFLQAFDASYQTHQSLHQLDHNWTTSFLSGSHHMSR